MTRGEPPPAHVLARFGIRGGPAQLEGGEGRSWRVGDAVLKPFFGADDEAEWLASLFERLDGPGFRVARPIRELDGAAVVDGWSAFRWLEGRHEQRWPEIVAAGDAFHAALAAEPRPPFLDRRMDPWALGDRVAWEERAWEEFRDVPHVARLAALRRPVDQPAQLVHGDLGGNVLFADGLPPAVIDFSPYWRPAGFATAIVVGDALTWSGAGEEILEVARHVAEFDQLLVRALIYRLVTDAIFHLRGERPPARAPDPFAAPVAIAARLVAERGATSPRPGSPR